MVSFSFRGKKKGIGKRGGVEGLIALVGGPIKSHSHAAASNRC